MAQDPPQWPESTRRLSQLRITIEFRSAQLCAAPSASARLNLDIVDYPGEWLIDLPLLEQSYDSGRADAVGRARTAARAWPPPRRGSNSCARSIPTRAEDEQVALKGARLFADYLKAARAPSDHVLHTTGPAAS